MITANSADLLEQTHHIKTGRWTSLEHKKFLEGLKIYDKDWKKIAELVGTRNNIQCRTHAQKHFKRIGSNNSFKENNKSVMSYRRWFLVTVLSFQVVAGSLPHHNLHMEKQIIR